VGPVNREYSRGGYIPGPTVTVKARVVGDRTEYWEPLIGAWVPVVTAAEVKALRPIPTNELGPS